MKNKSRTIPETAFFVFLICCLLVFCQKQHRHDYWTETGTVVENIKWEIALSDSNKVLTEEDDIWQLPQIPDTVLPETTVTPHTGPDDIESYKMAGRVHQILIHEGSVINRELYRFSRKGVELAGYTSTDSTQLLTVYDPPLLVLPSDLVMTDSVFISESYPKTWNAKADSFDTGQKTKIQVKLLKQGRVQIDTTTVPALLAELTLSMDGTVGFGGSNLIVPDAVMMQSIILFAERLGPLLEWGIRSREKAGDETDALEKDPGMDDRERFQEREYYVEVTLHHEIEQ